ncbi:restriction endonuclease subunit S [Parageobacillus thermoglucosidasius]|jgi:restriction endonuclease S subunit|uniref:restriction endonuclease subunit S n=1 Tax=Parageobacillus thermoglucosidasius TaxID=1426 RepID=UPI000B57E696|nr:restriction endonuclease subunit S [Parageobacillus thermoglucosidasius]OUM89885.1 MAG: restriction endonuclease [Parageobacillus thermoglucosidasius]
MYLGEIARIKVGLVVSRKKAEVDLEVKAEYPLISLKNIQADGTFTDEPIEIFKSKEVLDAEFFTREGNILVRLSHPNTAVLIDKEQEGLLIPSYFANVEIIDTNVLPGYVAWYLNTDKVKGELLKSQMGSHIPSTNKQILEKISIPELDLSKQQMITELQQLYRKEKRLYQKLMAEKEKFYKAVTYSIIKMNEG